jgi:hypothetical protein
MSVNQDTDRWRAFMNTVMTSNSVKDGEFVD